MTAREFAELAGVTVRTLHHYDRVGLLRPGRTDAGYRIYRERDLERLEQIVALKFLGLPLQQIGDVLAHDGRDLPALLRAQRAALEEKRRMLDRAIHAIREAERTPTPALLKKIIEEIEMQQTWTEKYYSPEARTKLDERRKQSTPEALAATQQKWRDLFAEVEAAMTDGEDPAGPRAQALGERWKAFEVELTGRDPEIAAGLNKLWQDRANWPRGAEEEMKPFSNPAIWDYMRRVFKAVS